MREFFIFTITLVFAISPYVLGLTLFYGLVPKAVDKFLLKTTPTWVSFLGVLTSGSFLAWLYYWLFFQTHQGQVLSAWRVWALVLSMCLLGALFLGSFVGSAAYFYRRRHSNSVPER